MAHLTHKLPWSSIPVVINHGQGRRLGRKDERVEFDKKAAHLVGALSSAIDEFASTDARSDEDKEAYDVLQWDTGFGYPYNGIYYLDIVGGIVGTYVVFNLLVEDEALMRPVAFSKSGLSLQQPAGLCDGGHPEQFADLLLPLLDNRHMSEYGRFSRYEIKKLTPEVLDGIRKYCAELFKIMYMRPEVFTCERMASDMAWRFDRLYKAIRDEREK